MKTTNPFIASVSDQSGEMVELIPQDNQTLTADEAVLYALEVLHTFARDRGQGELRTRHNAEMDTHMRTIRAALNQGQG